MNHKKIFIKSILSSLYFFVGLIFFAIVSYKAYSALTTVTTGSPLTATSWNEMISNFFWGSGTGGIFYNGKVGIGTSSPNKELHIKTTDGTNAELDIQSGTQPYWGIYQDETSQELRFWNATNKVSISNGGNLTVVGNLSGAGVCINGECKTDWNQVGGGSYTGTCDSAHKGATGVISNIYKICDGTNWLSLKNFSALGTATNPAYSCYQIKQDNYSSTDGIYRIDPNGGSTSDEFQVYCDMTTDGGGRSLVAKIAGNSSAHVNTAAVGMFTGINQGTAFKLSDTTINLIPKSFGYRFECGAGGTNNYKQTFGISCVFSATTHNGNSNCHPSGNSGLAGMSFNTGYSTYPWLAYGASGTNGCRAGGIVGNSRSKGSAGARRRENGWLWVK